jgi:hypothetical protein
MKVKSREVLWLLILVCSSLLILVAPDVGKTASETVRFGDLFPRYTFDSPEATDDRAYLGIPEGETFTIGDINADLIVLEVLNTYCTSCQKQASVYNEAFQLAEIDSATQGRIKWMGMGVGNNETEVAAFREDKGILFPILTDLDFKFYDAVGGPGGVRTPFTILIRKDENGRGIVVESHVGYRPNKDEIFEGIKAALQYDLAYLRIKEDERAVLPATKTLTPPVSAEDLVQRITNGMTMTGASVREVRQITLKDEVIYVGAVTLVSEEQQLFARVVSRPPICDICHDIHFIYIFDETGKIKNFVPIQLTKWGNRPWSDDDIEKMKSRLVGRSVMDAFQFDRDVDAVTRATITSVVIFDGLNKGKKIYTDLMREGYVK